MRGSLVHRGKGGGVVESRMKNSRAGMFALSLYAACLVSFPENVEATQRSYAAKAEFKRLHPCPSTGMKRGACPGWQIDHRTPLKCGGADRPINMQWLTIADHKAKTRREARYCRK